MIIHIRNHAGRVKQELCGKTGFHESTSEEDCNVNVGVDWQICSCKRWIWDEVCNVDVEDDWNSFPLSKNTTWRTSPIRALATHYSHAIVISVHYGEVHNGTWTYKPQNGTWIYYTPSIQNGTWIYYTPVMNILYPRHVFVVGHAVYS